MEKLVQIKAGAVTIEGELVIPPQAKGLVLFAHGSGSSRFSPRNNFVATVLQKSGLGTLLIDLLSKKEDEIYETRFDIDLLTERLLTVIEWLQKEPETKNLELGLFGSSTGAAAALKAAAQKGEAIKAVVSRGGRTDLANSVMADVVSPTLFIVGGNDFGVIELNQESYKLLKSPKKLEIVPNATHLFEEPGCLELVAQLASNWFQKLVI